jgi:hypothetical protein
VSNTGKSAAAAHDAAAVADEGQVGQPLTVAQVEYLRVRVDELSAGVSKAKQVADGAKAIAATLAEELKQARADLKAAESGRED